jgi:hypothetical protein
LVARHLREPRTPNDRNSLDTPTPAGLDAAGLGQRAQLYSGGGRTDRPAGGGTLQPPATAAGEYPDPGAAAGL